MGKCIYCNKEIKVNGLNIVNNSTLCLYCHSKFLSLNKTIKTSIIINNTKIEIKYNLLFQYNEYAKDYMHFYKEKGDIILCTLFSQILNDFIKEEMNYKTSTFTCIESSKKTYQKREFSPTYELLNLVNGIKIFKGPKRLDNNKQGKLSITKRKQQKHHYLPKSLPSNPNLIIFDDVITTGTTVENFLHNIENISTYKNIHIIILFASKNFNP